ncbi:MAG: hypothetical protein WAT37_13495 [Saprospiraceae bacterium]
MHYDLPAMQEAECIGYGNLKIKELDYVRYTIHFNAEEIFKAVRNGKSLNLKYQRKTPFV